MMMAVAVTGFIGHYLDATFKLVNQLDNFVLVGQQKLENKQYDSLSSMIHNLNSDLVSIS